MKFVKFIFIINSLIFSSIACNQTTTSFDNSSKIIDTIQQKKDRFIREKYLTCDSNKVYQQKIIYECDSTLNNSKLSNIDSLFIYFETGFDKTIIEIQAKNKFSNTDIYTTDESTGLAGELSIGNKSKLKNIFIKINNSKTCIIDLNGNEQKILTMKLINDTIILKFTNKFTGYL